MSQIFKTVMSIAIITLGVVIIGSLMIADADSNKAKQYKNDVIQEIECSNMSESVIDSCINTAAAQQYTLKVNKITDSSGKNVMCEVILNYNYTVPILKLIKSHECRGFAR